MRQALHFPGGAARVFGKGTSRPRSPNSRPSAWSRAGYTLIEMLTTVAVLIIVLGLMVSLARHVRERAAVALTKDVLRRLDQVMAEYAARHDGHLPAVASFPPQSPPDGGPTLRNRPAGASVPAGAEVNAGGARASSTSSARGTALDPSTRPDPLDADPERQPSPGVLLEAAHANNHDFVFALQADADLAGAAFGNVPVSIYDGLVLRDAWGSPIVFMPSKHPWIGTAPRDRTFFFFSAGPDRQYLTQNDNFYSYEDVQMR